MVKFIAMGSTTVCIAHVPREAMTLSEAAR